MENPILNRFIFHNGIENDFHSVSNINYIFFPNHKFVIVEFFYLGVQVVNISSASDPSINTAIVDLATLKSCQETSNKFQEKVQKFYDELIKEKISQSNIKWVLDLSGALKKKNEVFGFLKSPLIDLDVKTVPNTRDGLKEIFESFGQISIPFDTFVLTEFDYIEDLLKFNKHLLESLANRKLLESSIKKAQTTTSNAIKTIDKTMKSLKKKMTEIGNLIMQYVDLLINLETTRKNEAAYHIPPIKDAMHKLFKEIMKKFFQKDWIASVRSDVRLIQTNVEGIISVHEHLREEIDNLLPFPFNVNNGPKLYIVNKKRLNRLSIRLNGIHQGVQQFVAQSKQDDPNLKWIQKLEKLTQKNKIACEVFEKDDGIAMFTRKTITYFKHLLMSEKYMKPFADTVIKVMESYFNHFEKYLIDLPPNTARADYIYHKQMLEPFADVLSLPSKDDSDLMSIHVDGSTGSVAYSFGDSGVKTQITEVKTKLKDETNRTKRIVEQIEKLKLLIETRNDEQPEDKMHNYIESIKFDLVAGEQSFENQELQKHLMKAINGINVNIQFVTDQNKLPEGIEESLRKRKIVE